jgi:NAD(P)H-flavin reductase
MTTTLINTAGHSAGYNDKLLLPHWAEIVKIIPEAEGVTTFQLKFTDPEVQNRYRFEPGQFNMLYVPGCGEAAISMSSDLDTSNGLLVHTIRHIRNREQYGKVTLLYGARTPNDLLYPTEYETWQKAGFDMQVTVDRGDDNWTGRVGVVPMWFYHFRVDPHKTAVLTCGPEIMMRFVIYEALARRIPSEHIYISLERNMKCGQGACGHCQQGPYFICKDGPVFPFSALENIFNVEEY